jgi:pyruvate formate lyase activating enzyme
LSERVNTQGLIYNIQRYSIHDGPGIRTTVFLKGCSLRCLWCQNPESIKSFPEVGYSEIKCAKDYACVKACPRKAIKIVREGHPIHIDRKLCRICKEYTCVDACNNGALRLIGEYRTVEYVLNQIEQDALFYRNSNGGVTLSGGEPLHQPHFALNLLKECKEKGFHTALDTSGYADWAVLRETLPFVDLVLYDMKCFKRDDHLTFTGVSNETILQNLKSIASKMDTPVIARMPVIPGYNDSQENIIETAKFLKDIGIKEVTLLPYHKLGTGKYKIVGKKYLLKEVEVPDEGHLKHLKQLIENYGLQCESY